MAGVSPVPLWVVTIVKYLSPKRTRCHLAQIRLLDDCTAEDGRFIGHMVMNAALKVKKSSRADAVGTFVARTGMLRCD